MATVVRLLENHSARSPLILVIEDNEDDFFFIHRAFERAGIQAKIEWAKDGFEGRKFLEKSAVSGHLPACIILDIRMPLMDGWELLVFIRSNPKFDGIPVNVLAGDVTSTTLKQAIELGAKTYQVKPSGFEPLVQWVQSLKSQWTDGPPNP